MSNPPNDLSSFQSLVQIMAQLRAPNGCPWDLEQTHESLVPYLIEETFEVVDALRSNSKEAIVEELGDLLLQVVFHAQLGKDEGRFQISDVIHAINTKMISRHPHVFAETKNLSSEQVLTQWDVLKSKEGKPKKGLFDRIPKSYPALQTSSEIGRIVAKHGFDWSQISEVILKIKEELAEVEAELSPLPQNPKEKERVQDEVGDLLFCVAQLARKYDFSPEQALRDANKKFCDRYTHMLKQLELQGAPSLKELSDDQKEQAWQKAKKSLKK